MSTLTACGTWSESCGCRAAPCSGLIKAGFVKPSAGRRGANIASPFRTHRPARRARAHRRQGAPTTHQSLARGSAPPSARNRSPVRTQHLRRRRSSRRARRQEPLAGRRRSVRSRPRRERRKRRAARDRAQGVAQAAEPSKPKTGSPRRSNSKGATATAAIEAYERAVQGDETDVSAWINWGRLLHEQGEHEEAQSVSIVVRSKRCGRRCAVDVQPGRAARGSGRTDEALEAYQSAIEEDPTLADCHFNLARLYESLGKPQHAIRHLGQYRRLVSGHRSHEDLSQRRKDRKGVPISAWRP